ncbi:4-coumarate--CoA ligase-like 9 [Linum grandiflorum]
MSYYLRNVLNLSPNDIALVICPNCVQVPVLYLALLSLGVVVSPGNPVSTGSEIATLVDLARPIISFATSSTARKLPKLRLGTILVDSPQFESMTRHYDYESGGQVQVSQSDVAAILYSSGTTGRTKGVMLSHRNLIASVAAARSVAIKMDSPAVWLYTMPFFHMFGTAGGGRDVGIRFGGGSRLMVPETFDVWRSYTGEGRHICVHGEVPHCGTDSEKGYGLTESTRSAARLLGAEESRKWGSVGRLNGLLEARIVGTETEEALPPRKQGYMADAEATAATHVSDGWLRTGDLCYFDDQGFLYVVDRIKELIKYKGYQVAPAELEQLLQSHPGIADAAVIPYPDEEAGQVPFAFVVRRVGSSSLDAESVMEFVAKEVAPYKKIRRVAFVTSIPKSPAGKMLMKDLRKMLPETTKSRL